MKLVIKLANEIKEYCKSRNTCYGCPFFDEEIAYEDACSLRDRPMFWKDCGASMQKESDNG